MRKGRPRHQSDGWNQCPGPSPGEARFGAGPAAQGRDSKVVAVEAAVELAVARTCLNRPDMTEVCTITYRELRGVKTAIF